ncbi:MAG: hypothetical protein LBP59_11230 [Planctomycetaceae bacterium]|jgi:hypothetical protein|nr:hypothetical protein [Planctomycetaceae bacterium]
MVGMNHKANRLSAKQYAQDLTQPKKGTGCVQLPDGLMFLKFTEAGVVKLDVLPYRVKHPDKHKYAVDGLWYVCNYAVHKNVGGNITSIICPKHTWGKPCPICEHILTLNYNDPVEQAQIKAYRPQHRELYNVINLDDGKQYVLDQPTFLFGDKLNDLIKNADEDDEHYQYFADLEVGSTLKINIGQFALANKQKYYAATQIEFKQRKNKYDESILDQMVDLDSCLVRLSYKEIESLFNNHHLDDSDNTSDWSGDSDDGKHESSANNKTAKSESARPKLSNKPVRNDDDDNDNDEDEAPIKPQPKKTVVTKPVEDDDEDEDKTSAKKSKIVKGGFDESGDEASAKTAAPKKKSSSIVDRWSDDDVDDDGGAYLKDVPF